VPVLESVEERQRAVADVVGAEWNHFGGLQWTPEEVARVDADLAAGDEENHFHEAVPYVQFGLKLLDQARPDPSIDDEVIVALIRDFVPPRADEATPELVERVRRRRRERGEEADNLSTVEEYARFGLRVLDRARGGDWHPPEPEPPSLLRRLLGR
jgi:hypothetical protein